MINKIASIPIVREMLRYSPSKVISILVGIFSFKFYTETFSTHEYGLYNLILSTFSLITVFLTGWIGYVLIRFFERQKKDGTLHELLSTIYTVLIIIIAALFIVGIPSIVLFFNSQKLYFLAFLSLPLTMVTSLLSTYYQLNQDSKKYNVINVITGVGVFILFFLIYFFFNLKLTGFFLATIIINLFLILVAYFDFKDKRLNFKISKKYLVEYLRYGVPQIGTGVGVVLLSVTSRYFIQYFDGTEAVGIFSAAFKFGEMSILLPLGIFTSVFSPYIFREFEVNGEERAYQLILNYTVLYILCFGPIVILLSLFPSLPTILLGANFEESLLLIPIVCFGNFIFGYTQFLALYCQIDFKPIVITLSILISVFINIVLNFILIPKFGVVGAAYVTVLTYLAYIILLGIMSKIELKKVPIGSFVALMITAIVYKVIAYVVIDLNTSFLVDTILAASIWLLLMALMIMFKQIKPSLIFRKSTT